MRNIPFSPPDITELVIQEVCEALRSGWITTGPRTKQLEKELASARELLRNQSLRISSEIAEKVLGRSVQ